MRSLREGLGLTLRDVEMATNWIASRHRNSEYAISISRISDFESKGILPTIFKLYSLSVIYRRDLRDILRAYGVDVDDSTSDLAAVQPPNSHRVETLNAIERVQMPVGIDPAFDPRTTSVVGRMVLNWGTVPFAFLGKFADRSYTYAYVGTNDWTMYPLIPPGSFLQVDESKCALSRQKWASELERPIYFVETRQDFVCCWCEAEAGRLTLLPHPLSPVRMRVLRLGREAEILGQVVGVAMRLTQWLAPEPAPNEPGSEE